MGNGIFLTARRDWQRGDHISEHGPIPNPSLFFILSFSLAFLTVLRKSLPDLDVCAFEFKR